MLVAISSDSALNGEFVRCSGWITFHWFAVSQSLPRLLQVPREAFIHALQRHWLWGGPPRVPPQGCVRHLACVTELPSEARSREGNNILVIFLSLQLFFLLVFFTFCPIFVACLYLLVLPLLNRIVATQQQCFLLFYLVYLYEFVKKNKKTWIKSFYTVCLIHLWLFHGGFSWNFSH